MKPSRTTGSTKKLIMWYKVNELFSNGQTFSQISRNLGIDRHRVSNYVRMSESEFLSSGAYKRNYSHKLDEYENFIVDELKSCPDYSGKQIEDHLKEIVEADGEMVDRLVEHMKKAEGVTEKLKAENQMEWVGRMNSIRSRAEEIVLHDLFYN